MCVKFEIKNQYTTFLEADNCSETHRYICQREDVLYKHFDQLKSWIDAQKTCEAWGGSLASITSERENARIIGEIMGLIGNYWIGLTDIYKKASGLEWTD